MEGEPVENTKIPEELVVKKKASKIKDDEVTSELREDVLKLVKKKEIKCTAAKAKKAYKAELDLSLLFKYEKEQAGQVINYFSETIVGKFSDLLDYADFFDGYELEKNLEKDVLFQRDLKSLISQVIPYVPMVGLVCGGIIVVKHWFMGKECKGKDVVDIPSLEDRK